MRRSFIRTMCTAGLAVGAAACGDSGAGPSNDNQLGLNLATRPAALSAPGVALAVPETYNDNAGNVLVYERVQLVKAVYERPLDLTAGCRSTAGDRFLARAS